MFCTWNDNVEWSGVECGCATCSVKKIWYSGRKKTLQQPQTLTGRI